MNIEQYKQFIKDKRVSVIGIGVSNIPLIHFLTQNGAIVSAHDKKSAEDLGEIYNELSGLGVNLVLGQDYLSQIPEKTQIIFKTPGLRADALELVKAKENGVEITSEMELFFELCPGKIIAVTGSDGKTTTTTLIGEMLKAQGYNCYIGGNIGKPLIGDVEKMTKDDMIVLELSSFQLHTMRHSAEIAVITNVTPNHLDWHTDFNEYIETKKNIFKNCENCRVVLNFDNEITKNMSAEIQNYSYFSRKTELEEGMFLKNNKIVMRDSEGISEILDINDIKIPGLHNVENYMAAICATMEYVSVDTIRKVAKEFGGVVHRIEFVRELDGVKYYNDSIASSPARTTAGLLSFKQKVILIAGGYDKKIPFDDFGKTINERVKTLILVGVTSEKIEVAVKNADNYNNLEIKKMKSFEDAVKAAKDSAKEGDIVLLSPACASFDLFKNFEERGNTFKNIVESF